MLATFPYLCMLKTDCKEGVIIDSAQGRVVLACAYNCVIPYDFKINLCHRKNSGGSAVCPMVLGWPEALVSVLSLCHAPGIVPALVPR